MSDDTSFLERSHGAEPGLRDRNLLAEAWHALRRRWFLTLVVGAVAGSTVVVSAWFVIPRQYTATAVLRVSAAHSGVLNLSDRHEGLSGFEIFKRTQRQYIRGPRILASVLQREAVASKIAPAESDPLSWLQQIVNVTFPDEAEIMLVSVRADDRETAETIANTLVDVYLDDVNDVERRTRMNRLNDLEKAYTDSESSLRKRRLDLRQYAEALGTFDSAGLTLPQKNAMHEYLTLWTQLNQVEFELIKWTSARKMSAGSDVPRTDPIPVEVTDAEDEYAATGDPIIAGLTAQLERVQSGLEEARRRFTADAAPFKRFAAEQQPELDRIHDKIAKRRAALKKELATKKDMALAAAGKNASSSIAALESQRKLLTERVAALRKDAEKFGRPSVDVELMQAEIKAMEEIQNYIQRELHEAKVEVASAKPRIVLLSPAVAPQLDAWKSHLESCTISGVLAFLAAGATVVGWDLRWRRLNTASEVTRLLRLPLLGTVPPVTGRKDPGTLVEEAMDGIAATIVFSTPEESHRLLLVTSAAPGEGKTTVAAGLAMSLARMGRPTLLVDFDLQCPALNEMFGVELGPGTADLLADRLSPSDVTRSTMIENLSVVPAGQWDQRGFAGWGNDRLERILSEFRLNFAHVVIDSAPLLPSVETRLLAPHVDGVVIVLLRDVSEINAVRSACELLWSCDANLLGAALIGAPRERYERRKNAAAPVRPTQPPLAATT